MFFTCKRYIAFFLLCNLVWARPDITILSTGIATRGRVNGPQRVLASLLHGFDQLGVSYNLDPIELSDVAEIVHVPVCKWALKQMIRLKKRGKIKTLIAGPNFYHEEDVLSPYVDAYLVPSQATKNVLMARRPDTTNMFVWPAGVDCNTWKPHEKNPNSNKVLIYFKMIDDKPLGRAFVDKINHICRIYGWEPRVLEYGFYDHHEYKSILKDTRFAVFLTQFESQGIAMAEAWAMNVPTLCYNPQIPADDVGNLDIRYPSCPYLTEDTGRTWKEIEQLEQLVAQFTQYESMMRPREWILDHLTDAHCAEYFLEVIKCINK